MKNFFLLLTILLSACHLYSQTPEVETILASAAEELESKQYRRALILLDQAKIAQGGNTSKIQSMRVIAYYGLEYYDDAKKEINNYFNTYTEKDEGYEDMLRYLGKLNNLNTPNNPSSQKAKVEDLEEKAWANIRLNRNYQDVENYLIDYPQGIYSRVAYEYVSLYKRYQESKIQLDETAVALKKAKRRSSPLFLLAGIPLMYIGMGMIVEGSDLNYDYYNGYSDTGGSGYIVGGAVTLGLGTILTLKPILRNNVKKNKKAYQSINTETLALESQIKNFRF